MEGMTMRPYFQIPSIRIYWQKMGWEWGSCQ